MYTFYNLLKNCSSTLMLIKNKKHVVFGAYVSEKWHHSRKYYGKNDSFVFKKNIGGGLQIWRASKGDESFYQFSGKSIFLGLKDSSAIFLSPNFISGSTSFCPSFDSPSLIGDGKETAEFDVLCLEVWAPSYDM